MWTDVLTAAGVEVRAADERSVMLRHGDQRGQFRLKRYARPPRPNEVRAVPWPDALLVAPDLSAQVRARLLATGWSWVSDSGYVHLRFPGAVVDADPTAPQAVQPAKPAVRARGVGGFAVLRRIIEAAEGTAVRQVDLAATTAMSQARVSQLLSLWRRDGIVEGSRAAWRVSDRARALDVWLAGYPGPGGTTTHWVGLDGMWPAALSVLDRLPVGSVTSGDAAADLLAPWRRPVRAVLYATQLPDLGATGLVPVVSADEASVTVVVPADRSVWPVEPLSRTFEKREVALADPLQVLWDLTRSGGLDADQASARLRAWVETQYATEATVDG